ncbi:hypothetical protein MXB_5295, partial [Myxobolus squamalis]
LTKSQASIAALKNIILERIEIEKKLEIQTFNLQLESQKETEILENKVKAIIEGKEILYEDCSKFLSLVPLDTLLSSLETSSKTPCITESSSSDEFGLKKFWFTALLNFRPTAKSICANDEPVLSFLTDICTIQISPEHRLYLTQKGLILEFHFSPNKYFSNAILFKYYRLGFSKSDDNPLDHNGMIPLEVVVSPIDWFPEMNY